MGTLSYNAIMSLDGYVADASGDFQWSAPGGQTFAAHVDRMAEVATEVLGRKTFALMQYWETDPVDEEWSRQNGSSRGGGAASTKWWCRRR